MKNKKKVKKIEDTMNWLWIITGLILMIWKLNYGMCWIFSAFLYRGKL